MLGEGGRAQGSRRQTCTNRMPERWPRCGNGVCSSTAHFASQAPDLTFGLDPILGLIPGLGDLTSPFFAALLLLHAVRMRIPRIVQLRMVINAAIDSSSGSIPVVGRSLRLRLEGERAKPCACSNAMRIQVRSRPRATGFSSSAIVGGAGCPGDGPAPGDGMAALAIRSCSDGHYRVT